MFNSETLDFSFSNVFFLIQRKLNISYNLAVLANDHMNHHMDDTLEPKLDVLEKL